MARIHSNRINLTGQQFGRLSVLKPAESRNGRTAWDCLCECGISKIILTEHLRMGLTKSCGCRERMKHGMHKTPEYKSWQSLKNRCLNRHSLSYKDYGGRGIKVCDRWLESFENFFADMGKRPSPRHSIDRYPDNDGNYEPSNCRWATDSEQSRNKRGLNLITFNGETHCVSDWAIKLGINYDTLRRRIERWSVKDALTKPVDLAHRRTTL